MLSLGKTIAKLTQHRRQFENLWKTAPGQAGRGQASSRTFEPPVRRLTEVTAFGSNPGHLRMFQHVPADLEATPALVVVLHGCTQTAASYDYGAGWSTLADRYGFILLLPQQEPANNPNRCFNWFLPGDTKRDRGEARSIRQMVDTMIRMHGVGPQRVFVTGLSAGGAMTSVMLATYPEVFAGGAIIAGLPYGAATSVQGAYESMFQGSARPARAWGDLVRAASPHRGPWPRVSVWHGEADATVKPMNAEEIIKQWTDVHGLDAAPARNWKVDGYPRQVWRNAAREDVIESYTITSMAHGTPLATDDADEGCGAAGAFLLDVGISSSYHIAKFFGLTGRKRLVPAQELASIAPEQPLESEPTPPEQEAAHAGPEPVGAARSLAVDVEAVITKALKAAGLIRS